MRAKEIPPIDASIAMRFWDKVNVTNYDECWLWNADTDIGGYGVFVIHHESFKANRVVYTMVIGYVPLDRATCHRCDTPSCVNPYHLFLGTLADNKQDMMRKGKAGKITKLNWEAVDYIRASYPKLSYYQLGEIYNVDSSTICRVVNNQTWTR